MIVNYPAYINSLFKHLHTLIRSHSFMWTIRLFKRLLYFAYFCANALTRCSASVSLIAPGTFMLPYESSS